MRLESQRLIILEILQTDLSSLVKPDLPLTASEAAASSSETSTKNKMA